MRAVLCGPGATSLLLLTHYPIRFTSGSASSQQPRSSCWDTILGQSCSAPSAGRGQGFQFMSPKSLTEIPQPTVAPCGSGGLMSHLRRSVPVISLAREHSTQSDVLPH